jgi:phosphate:Na+ symporter
MLERLVPGEAQALPIWPEFLNEACLTRTEEALLCVKRELGRQMLLAKAMVRESIDLLRTFRKAAKREQDYVEAVVDNLRTEIAVYLWKISDREFSQGLSKQLFTYTAMVDDIERIADHAVILTKLSEEKHARRIEFSDKGMVELEEIHALVMDNVKDAAVLIAEADEAKILEIYRREECIDTKVREAREKHLERFHRRICRAEAGPIFLEMLINLERISDRCQNIAEYVEELQGP